MAFFRWGLAFCPHWYRLIHHGSTKTLQKKGGFKTISRQIRTNHKGVSKNGGTPKWMVKIMENPIKVDDLGGFPPIFGSTPINLKTTATHRIPSRSGRQAASFSKEISTARPPKNCFLAKRAAEDGHGTCNQVAKNEI